MRKSKAHLVEYGAGGHNDVAYGVYDRPGPDVTSEDLPDFEPITPKEQVSMQLSLDRPPVEDPDYSPTDQRAFELSVSTLASYVPEENIKALYTLFRNEVEKLTDENLLKSKYAGGEVMESLEHQVRKMISEQFTDADLRRMQAEFEEEFGAPAITPSAQPPRDEATLAQIAPEAGFAGPAGVKNFLYRLLGKMARFKDVPGDEIDALVDFAAGEYVDIMEQAGLIDSDEAKLMAQNKKIVTDLPSFKFFIGKAIAGPAIKELEKKGKKQVQVFLDKLALTKPTTNSIMNQLVGQVPKDLNALNSRIDKEVADGKLTPEKGEDAKTKLRSGFDAMKELAMAGDDFVEIALQRYSKMPKSKLVDIIKKASKDPYVAEKM